MYYLFEISRPILNHFQVWALLVIPKPSSVFPGGTSCLILRYALGHCLAGIATIQLQCLDLKKLASGISWYLAESILPSTRIIFPLPPAATQPESMMDQLPCLTVVKVFSTKAFFSKRYLLWWWPKSYILVLTAPSTLFQKASVFSMFSFAHFRLLIGVSRLLSLTYRFIVQGCPHLLHTAVCD